MSLYKTCSDCGANLDSGERCGCAGAIRNREKLIDCITQIEDEQKIKTILAFVRALTKGART